MKAPRLSWANNPHTFAERDALQRVVDAVHALHALRGTHVHTTMRGRSLRLVSAASGHEVGIPMEALCGEVDREGMLRPLAAIMDRIAVRAAEGERTAFATMTDAMVLRSAMSHDRFERLVTHPAPLPTAHWVAGGWEMVETTLEHDEDLRPGVRMMIEKGLRWHVRRRSDAWDYDGTHIHVPGLSVPAVVAAAGIGRPLDATFGLPGTHGCGLLVANVRDGRRRGAPSTRITAKGMRNPPIVDVLAMSRSMAAAHP